MKGCGLVCSESLAVSEVLQVARGARRAVCVCLQLGWSALRVWASASASWTRSRGGGGRSVLQVARGATTRLSASVRRTLSARRVWAPPPPPPGRGLEERRTTIGLAGGERCDDTRGDEHGDGRVWVCSVGTSSRAQPRAWLPSGGVLLDLVQTRSWCERGATMGRWGAMSHP